LPELSRTVPVVLESQLSQPGGNVTTTKMKEFSAAEPDPAPFAVPVGYKVVDETGEFTCKVTK